MRSPRTLRGIRRAGPIESAARAGLALTLLLCGSCREAPRPQPGPEIGPDYVASILEWRQKREAFFHDSPESPVRPAERGTFAPLEYYPVDPSWRLTLPVMRYPNPETFFLITNTGERRALSRDGQVEINRDGASIRLQLYRELDGTREPGSFWIPFIDAAAGKETYPAGRYLDAELRPDGTILLDFNLTYNPYCAYGLDFSCPLTPRENRLPIAVRAGEKGFHRPSL